MITNSIQPLKLQKLLDDTEQVIFEVSLDTTVTNTDDGGTCNLDCVVIKLPYTLQKDLEAYNKIANAKISGPLSGIYRGYRFLNFDNHGQANRRTRFVEAYHKKMKILGYDVQVYYQMD